MSTKSKSKKKSADPQAVSQTSDSESATANGKTADGDDRDAIEAVLEESGNSEENGSVRSGLVEIDWSPLRKCLEAGEGWEVTQEDFEAWKVTAQQCADPSTARLLFQLVGGTDSENPLTWMISADSMPEILTVGSMHEALLSGSQSSEQVRKLLADKITLELQNIAGDDAGSVMTALGAAYSVHAIADQFEMYHEWHELIRLLRERITLDGSERSQSPLFRVLNIELALAMMFQLPEFAAADKAQRELRGPVGIADPGLEKLEELVDEVLDHDGWPKSDYLECFGPLVVSLSRSFAIIRKLELLLHPDTESKLEWIVRQFVRMTRADGRLVFSHYSSLPVSEGVRKNLLAMTDDPQDESIFKACLDKKKPGKSKRSRLPETSAVSEWGESGVLRSHWGKGSPMVGFDYSNDSFRLEIAAKKLLLSGVAMPNVKFDGKVIKPIEPFDVVCEQHDSDLDYVEFQMQMTESITLGRQLILSRDEQFLIVADSIVPLKSGRIEYECNWPMAKTPESQIKGMRETENTEIYLRTKKIHSLVLPLSLPEWQVGPSSGKLEIVDQALRLTDSMDGGGLYVPLFIDLNPKRSKKKRTWRSLSVVENMETISRDVGAAFRVQCNKQQWLFYRSLARKGIRTFLGENFGGEFVISRFDEDGVVTEMLIIE